MINQKRLINTFKKLAKINSPSKSERKIVDYLQKELKLLGWRNYLVGDIPEGETKNLVAEIPGNNKSSSYILLNAHLDTVAPVKNIKLRKKKNYFLSAGKTILGADDKAGVAAILEVIRTLQEKKLKHPPLKIIFTVAEEIGLLGAKALPTKILKNIDFGLVIDGGDINKIINQAPAQFNLTATIMGKAAHAGLHPEKGINAIRVASCAIAKMKLGRIDQETTANIGVIHGGKAVNIVPDEVQIKGEARSHNFSKLQKQIRQMKKILLETCKNYGAKLKLKIDLVYKAFVVDQKEEVIQIVSSAMKKLGIKAKIEASGGGSDANIFNALGIPTVILGIGADHVHTSAERLKIKDFLKGTELLRQTIIERGNEKTKRNKN